VNRDLRTSIWTYDHPGDRSVQEDVAYANAERGVSAVADGFGGAGSGDVAAREAIEAVSEYLETQMGDQDATLPFVLRKYFSLSGNILFNAVLHANARVLKGNREKNVHEKGGASLLVCTLDRDFLSLAAVGSCRSGLIRQGQFRGLSVPRSLGGLENPFSEGDRVPLTAIGLGTDLEPELVEFRVRSGDWLLLESGGLDQNERDAIAQICGGISKSAQAMNQCRSLVSESSRRGNLSLSLIYFE